MSTVVRQKPKGGLSLQTQTSKSAPLQGSSDYNSRPPQQSSNKPKTLRSAHSLADLKSSIKISSTKWTKRFNSNNNNSNGSIDGHHTNSSSINSRKNKKNEFDFGCAGEYQPDFEELQADEIADMLNYTAPASVFPAPPPVYSRSTSISSSSRMTDHHSHHHQRIHSSRSSSQELERAEQRRREEAAAAEACLVYMTSHTSLSPRTSSSAAVNAKSISSYSTSYDDSSSLRRPSGESHDAIMSSLSSSSCYPQPLSNERPRTNDSLPSYHTNSQPPSPAMCSSLTFSANTRRPSLTTHSSVPIKRDLALDTPRAYSFI